MNSIGQIRLNGVHNRANRGLPCRQQQVADNDDELDKAIVESLRYDDEDILVDVAFMESADQAQSDEAARRQAERDELDAIINSLKEIAFDEAFHDHNALEQAFHAQRQEDEDVRIAIAKSLEQANLEQGIRNHRSDVFRGIAVGCVPPPITHYIGQMGGRSDASLESDNIEDNSWLNDDDDDDDL